MKTKSVVFILSVAIVMAITSCDRDEMVIAQYELANHSSYNLAGEFDRGSILFNLPSGESLELEQRIIYNDSSPIPNKMAIWWSGEITIDGEKYYLPRTEASTHIYDSFTWKASSPNGQVYYLFEFSDTLVDEIMALGKHVDSLDSGH